MRPSIQQLPALALVLSQFPAIKQAAQAAGALDVMALRQVAIAADFAEQWTRDYCESTRARARAAAAAAVALATSDGANSLTRQALTAYAGALTQFLGCYYREAIAAARGAQGALYR